MTDTIEIETAHLQIIRTILDAHLPSGVQVWVFGSRARHAATRASDLDLALEGKSRLDNATMAKLEYSLEMSALPYEVDVVDLNDASDGFRDIINAQRIALPALRGPGRTRRLDAPA